jgi:hypothetical protein
MSIINGGEINQPGVAINGAGSGSGVVGNVDVVFTLWLDEKMFDLLIAGKLSVKDKVCAVGRTPAPRIPVSAKYRAVCSKVKP